MAKKNRLTLEDLIKASDKKAKEATKTQEIEIPSIGGTLLFKRPSDDIILDMINTLSEDQDTKAIIDEMAKIIYACCDQLHDKKLYEELDVGDPVDTVYAVMESGDILAVGDELCSMNSLYKEAGEMVKNA